jgi:hypothetical protein
LEGIEEKMWLLEIAQTLWNTPRHWIFETFGNCSDREAIILVKMMKLEMLFEMVKMKCIHTV